METFLSVSAKLAQGFGTTLALFFLTLLFAIPLGLLFACLARARFKPVRWLMRAFIYIIRGTPLLLQLMIVVYLPGIVFDHPLTKWEIFHQSTDLAYFCGALFAFVINYACYFSEIFRGGIQSIPVGQYEAGQVLGLTKTQTFFRVVLLQVIKRIVPPMSNEIITLVKDTSLARIIALQEIIWAGQAFMKGSHGISGAIWPMFFTMVYYLLASGILTVLLGRLEKKLSYFKV